MKWATFPLMAHVRTINIFARLILLPELSHERAVRLLHVQPIYQILVQAFHCIPPSFSLSYVSAGRVTISPAVLSPLSCSCPTLHLPLHTHGPKHTPVLYNEHAGLFLWTELYCDTPGTPFLSFSHRVMVCSVGSDSCVWTRVNERCANIQDKKIMWK